MIKSTLLRSLAATVFAVSTISCSSEAPPQPAESAPEAPAGISVADGWMALPAVAGNPAAVYFTLTNASTAPARLSGAYLAGAQSAMLHETMAQDGKMTMREMEPQSVAPGETVVFAPGERHVMAMDLDPGLSPGGETEATLTFDTGDKVSFPVAIYAAGDMPDGTEIDDR